MSSQSDLGFVTLLATAAISQFVAVDIQPDGTINVPTAPSRGVGVTQENVPAGRYCNVKLWSAPGTWMIQVTGTAVTPGNAYAIVTGGYAGVTATGVATPNLEAFQAGVASNGIVLEFTKL